MMIKKNRAIILAILLALSIRLIFFIAIQPWDEQVVRDTIIYKDGLYHRLALEILNSGTFSGPSSTLRTPIYPLFIAFFYLLFGVKVWVVLLAQVILDTSIIIIIYFIAKEMFESEFIGKFAAFLYAVSFLSAFYAIRIFSEVLFTLIFTLSILIFIRALKNNRIWGFAMVGLLLGLATLTRPILQYYFAILIIIFLCSPNKTAKKAYSTLVVVVCFATVVTPWQLRNLHKYNNFALTTVLGNNLLRDYAAAIKAVEENTTKTEAIKAMEGNALEGLDEHKDAFEISKIRKKIALDNISKQPVKYALFHLKGSINMFLGTAKGNIMLAFGLNPKKRQLSIGESYTNRISRIIKNSKDEFFLTPILGAKQFFEYFFLLIGLIFMFLNQKKRYAFLVISTLIYFALLTGMLGAVRYRVPLIPLYLVITAYGFYEIIEYFRKMRHGWPKPASVDS